MERSAWLSSADRLSRSSMTVTPDIWGELNERAVPCARVDPLRCDHPPLPPVEHDHDQVRRRMAGSVRQRASLPVRHRPQHVGMDEYLLGSYADCRRAGLRWLSPATTTWSATTRCGAARISKVSDGWQSVRVSWRGCVGSSDLSSRGEVGVHQAPTRLWRPPARRAFDCPKQWDGCLSGLFLWHRHSAIAIWPAGATKESATGASTLV